MARFPHVAPPQFNPAVDYVWIKDGRCNGEPVAAGDLVDRKVLDDRRLQVLFETRRIKPAGFQGPAPKYLNNGLGKADQLRAEIEREEAEAAKNSVKGEGDAQPRSDAEPAAPRGARAAKPAHTVGKKPAERLGSAKPAAKSAPKRAQARSR